MYLSIPRSKSQNTFARRMSGNSIETSFQITENSSLSYLLSVNSTNQNAVVFKMDEALCELTIISCLIEKA